MEMTVRDLINEINTTRTQTSASAKDENRVMRAMLNDPTFVVGIYGRSGLEGTYCPYEEARALVTNIIKETTKIPTKEAIELADNYEFGKQEANIMIGLSKEFINTYLETGRKLPLGGRKDSNISISKKIKKERTGGYPQKVGVNSDGSDKFVENPNSIPEHGSLKVYSQCPSWLKNNKK